MSFAFLLCFLVSNEKWMQTILYTSKLIVTRRWSVMWFALRNCFRFYTPNGTQTKCKCKLLNLSALWKCVWQGQLPILHRCVVKKIKTQRRFLSQIILQRFRCKKDIQFGAEKYPFLMAEIEKRVVSINSNTFYGLPSHKVHLFSCAAVAIICLLHFPFSAEFLKHFSLCQN